MSFAIRPIALALVTGAALAALPAPAEASTEAAREVIVKVTSEGVAVLRDNSLTREQKYQRLEKIAFDNMDFETVSRLCLGRHWRNVPENKRAEFLAEFKKRLIVSYSRSLDEYSGQDVVVTGSRQEPDGDWTVESVITNSDKKEVAKVNYRLRGKSAPPAAPKVIDITIEGISLVANYRSQFQELMTNGGIDKVLTLLREKNAGSEK